MTTAVLNETAGPQPLAHHGRRRWLLAGAVACAVAGTITLVLALLPDDAHSLYPYAGVNESLRSVPVGRTVVIGADVQPRSGTAGHAPLDVHQVQPRVTVNTAHATIVIVECRVADPHTGVGTGYLADLRELCTTVRTFASGPLDLGFPATELVYEVTAPRPAACGSKAPSSPTATAAATATKPPAAESCLRLPPTGSTG